MTITNKRLNGGQPIIFSKIPQMNRCSLFVGVFFSSQRGSPPFFEKGKMEVRDEDKIMRIKSNKNI